MKNTILFILLVLIFFSCNQSKNNSSNQEKIERIESMENDREGVITKISTKSFADTYTSLIEIITNNPNLRIITELDHKANAASVGLQLNPTKIILFGNPKLGSPLMQNSQTTALDLPQKILIYEDKKGVVRLAYNDPNYLKQRHKINKNDEILTKIDTALDKITDVVCGI